MEGQLTIETRVETIEPIANGGHQITFRPTTELAGGKAARDNTIDLRLYDGQGASFQVGQEVELNFSARPTR